MNVWLMRRMVLAIVFMRALAASAMSPCCGGVSAAALPIIGLERQHWIVSAVSSQIPLFARTARDVRPVEGVASNAMGLRYVHAVSPAWQLALQTSMSAFEGQERRWGDSDFTIYRRMSGFRPWPLQQMFLSLRTTAPTGVAQWQDPRNPSGSGQWQNGLGIQTQGTLGSWDAELSVLASHAWPRRLNKGSESIVLQGNPGFQFRVGGGYNPGLGAWRLGLMVGHQIEAATSSARVDIQDQGYSWDVLASISYTPVSRSSVAISYRDETLLGPARNTWLEREVSLTVLYRVF